MDYKILFTRFFSSFLLMIIIFPIIIYYNKLLLLIVFFIYLFIFYEVRNNFNFKKIIYIYLILSLLASEFYIFYFFNLNFFIIFVLVIILFDSYSYLFGSIFKGKRAFPHISPNKTYSGLILGYLFTTISIYLLNKFFILSYSINKLLFFTSLIILFSLIGDLLESFFKRKSNIKDSSQLIPGHGGFFDRFDSFIFAAFLLPISIYL
tara:strand:+ start:2929 stop:3549 length:621 start_codon:yes stop_codon:yes gene_type:complete